MQLSRIMIYAKDLDRMAEFYVNVLGLRAVKDAQTEGWMVFDAGGCQLALHAIPTKIAGQLQISSPPRPREENPVKLHFQVEDVTAETRRLELSGVTVIQRPWGGYDAIDPEGNVFGIFQAG